MYNFNYKTSFFLATTSFSAANKGRILYGNFSTYIASKNVTIPPLITDIIEGVAVGLPGILIILKLLLGISLNLYPLIVVIALSLILSYVTCVLILLHMIGSVRYAAGN